MLDNLKTLINILNETDDLFLRIENESIQSHHKIIDDLAIDSLTRITIFYEIQDHFEKEGDDLISAKWVIVQDILNYMDTLSE